MIITQPKFQIPPTRFASGWNASTAEMPPSPAAVDVPLSTSATVRAPMARQNSVALEAVAAVSCVEHIDAVAAVDFEAEVATLEAQWARDGIMMNATTFFVAASNSSRPASNFLA